MTYQIVRCYFNDWYHFNDWSHHIIKSGLTLEEAQAHCGDPETSSRTCTSAEGRERTELYGAWFDAYEEETS
jgi:transcription elongation factor Elf1